jgi:hypothetical protein
MLVARVEANTYRHAKNTGIVSDFSFSNPTGRKGYRRIANIDDAWSLPGYWA